jgi:hypothetical protein
MVEIWKKHHIIDDNYEFSNYGNFTVDEFLYYVKKIYEHTNLKELSENIP